MVQKGLYNFHVLNVNSAMYLHWLITLRNKILTVYLSGHFPGNSYICQWKYLPEFPHPNGGGRKGNEFYAVILLWSSPPTIPPYYHQLKQRQWHPSLSISARYRAGKCSTTPGDDTNRSTAKRAFHCSMAGGGDAVRECSNRN